MSFPRSSHDGPVELRPSEHSPGGLRGIQGKGSIITFPEGTTRTVLYPQAVHARYRIVLPDGIELREVEDRFTEKSLLSIALDTLPDSEKG